LVTSLRQLGAEIEYEANEGYPPLHIKQPNFSPSSSTVEVRGEVSSQFLTALLMAAPLWTASQGQALTIEVEGRLISQPYIAITLAMMADFGVQVVNQDWQRFVVHAEAQYQSPGAYHVEGDASSASYFLALGAIGG